MYKKEELRQLVSDTLYAIGKSSPDAINLIMGIIAQESDFGRFRKQLGGGPALGICQIEPTTFQALNAYLFKRNKALHKRMLEVCNVSSLNSIDLISNDKLSICMCRVFFLRFTEKLPSTIEGYAKLWKLRYNTYKGKGTEEQFIENYKKYVL